MREIMSDANARDRALAGLIVISGLNRYVIGVSSLWLL